MARYYNEEGVVTEVAGSKGKPVKCTLTHARKYGYIPSVTTITSLWTQAILMDWAVKECSKIAYEGGRWHSEDALKYEFDHRSQARMDAGTKVHDEIEQLLLNNSGDFSLSSKKAYSLTRESLCKYNSVFTAPEKFVFSRENYVAGRIDVLHTKGVLDYKTKATKKGKPIPKATEAYVMQQAAYTVGEYGLDKLDDTETFGGVIWISTTEPERVEFELIDNKKLKWGWECFSTLSKFYRTIKKL